MQQNVRFLKITFGSKQTGQLVVINYSKIINEDIHGIITDGIYSLDISRLVIQEFRSIA